MLRMLKGSSSNTADKLADGECMFASVCSKVVVIARHLHLLGHVDPQRPLLQHSLLLHLEIQPSHALFVEDNWSITVVQQYLRCLLGWSAA